MATHNATIDWRRADHDLPEGQYGTGHVWEFDGGAVVPASASPHVVKPPASVAANVDPEEAFVAALSSCHMLFYLYLAEKVGFPVATYRDAAEGLMERVGKGKQAITRVTLRPEITYVDAAPDAAKEDDLHHQSHEACFIANSAKSEVVVEPVR